MGHAVRLDGARDPVHVLWRGVADVGVGHARDGRSRVTRTFFGEHRQLFPARHSEDLKISTAFEHEAIALDRP
ncbi:hypothetical protein BN2537_5043 [Streptomyces venezuelae]|nr:hypothetical protein BN2537_5043 [Streptomyces venezuelae]